MNSRIAALAAAAALALTTLAVAPADAAAPDVSGVTVEHAKIYPNVLSLTTTRPPATRIEVTGDVSTVSRIDIRNTSGVAVRGLPVAENGLTIWNGRDTAGLVVPAGTYKAVVIGTPEESPVTGTIIVNTQKLVRKVYVGTVTAAGSIIDKFVGKCSKLVRPSKRGWKGSIGLYSNAKCKKKSRDGDIVATQHIARVPVAERYVDVQVNTYGGAAKAKKGSKGILLYYRLTNDPVAARRILGSKVGNHPGPVIPATNLVDRTPAISWGVGAVSGARYDLKSFTVVVHYDVLR